jgi:hypothetical protein
VTASESFVEVAGRKIQMLKGGTGRPLFILPTGRLSPGRRDGARVNQNPKNQPAIS